jgi:hypothetical protein
MNLPLSPASAVAPAVPVEQPALLAVLRLETPGAILAREPVLPEDLAAHVAEAWREGCLRMGRPGVPFSAAPIWLRPIFKPGQRLACAGFALETRLPGADAVPTAFTNRSLDHVAGRAARRLLNTGRLKEGQTYLYEIHFESRGSLVVHHGPERRAPMRLGEAQPVRAASECGAPIPVHGPEARPKVEVEAQPEADQNDFETTDCSPPLAFLEVPLRRMIERGSARQAMDEDAFHVFFTADAFARAEQFARKGANVSPPVESGAALAGVVCSCPDTGDLFVIVTDAYEVMAADQKTCSLELSHESWRRIRATIKARAARCPALRLVGQTHGHNFLPAGGQTCEACPTRPVCDLTNVFASPADETWTISHFAGQPWSICAIFGLSARADRLHDIFTQHNARLHRRGYFILPDFNPEQWPCRNVGQASGLPREHASASASPASPTEAGQTPALR